MLDAIKKSIIASLGVLSLSREKIQEAVNKFVQRGELTKEQAEKIIEELVERGKVEQQELHQRVLQMIDSALSKVGGGKAEDLAELEARVTALERRLDEIESKMVTASQADESMDDQPMSAT